MYGDMQSVGVYRVNPSADAPLEDGVHVDKIVFVVKGARKATDVVLGCNFAPTAAQPTLAEVALGQGYISADDEVTVPLVAEVTDFSITTAYAFDITVARTRTKNSGVLL
jgi:hypothetical protein